MKGFFSTCDQIRSILRIWSHLMKKSLMENFIFCAVLIISEFGNKEEHHGRRLNFNDFFMASNVSNISNMNEI